MAGRTEENLIINFDVMSCVSYDGQRISKARLEKLKEEIKKKVSTLIYDEVLEFEDDWGDSGLTDFTLTYVDCGYLDHGSIE